MRAARSGAVGKSRAASATKTAELARFFPIRILLARASYFSKTKNTSNKIILHLFFFYPFL